MEVARVSSISARGMTLIEAGAWVMRCSKPEAVTTTSSSWVGSVDGTIIRSCASTGPATTSRAEEQSQTERVARWEEANIRNSPV